MARIDKWKRSVWVLSQGHTMQVGKRTTAANTARAALGDTLPECWHVVRVLDQAGVRVGFGLHREPIVAKLAALFEAGLVKPVVCS